MRKISSLLSLLVTFAFAVSLLTSCQKPTDDTVVKKAPELPAKESFIMPFTGFEDTDTSGFANWEADDRNSTSIHNWLFSATNVVVWNVVTTANLAIPVAAFNEALKADPIYQGDNVWTWTYTATVDGGIYQCELSGEILNNDEDVEWIMHISKAGAFTDVLWYSGVTSIDRTEAKWMLNHKPNNPENFLSIHYTKDENANVASIKYTNVIPNSADNGDYIQYREDNNPDAIYNRGYDVLRIKDDNLLEINWNHEQNFGRVKNKAEFGDSEWHCWDMDFLDTECS